MEAEGAQSLQPDEQISVREITALEEGILSISKSSFRSWAAATQQESSHKYATTSAITEHTYSCGEVAFSGNDPGQLYFAKTLHYTAELHGGQEEMIARCQSQRKL